MAIAVLVKSEHFIIRNPTACDFEQLLSIERRCFRAHRFTLDDFRHHLRNPASIFALAAKADVVIGYVAGVVHRVRGEPTANIYSMAVLPEFRRHRVAAKLLEYFENESRQRGSGSVTLEVRQTNRAARKLYVGAGYKVDKILKDYYAAGSNGLLMRKQLSA